MSLIDAARLESYLQCVKDTKRLSGTCIVEVGVYKGGSIDFIAPYTTRTIYGFDTFQGMPSSAYRHPTKDTSSPSYNKSIDFHVEGDFSDTNYDAVSIVLGKYRHVELHAGRFPDSFHALIGELPLISVLHIDVDIYESVYLTFKALEGLVIPGGYVVLDDYGAPSCPGAAMAVHRLLSEYSDRYLIERVVGCQLVLKRVDVYSRQ